MTWFLGCCSFNRILGPDISTRGENSGVWVEGGVRVGGGRASLSVCQQYPVRHILLAMKREVRFGARRCSSLSFTLNLSIPVVVGRLSNRKS